MLDAWWVCQPVHLPEPTRPHGLTHPLHMLRSKVGEQGTVSTFVVQVRRVPHVLHSNKQPQTLISHKLSTATNFHVLRSNKQPQTFIVLISSSVTPSLCPAALFTIYRSPSLTVRQFGLFGARQEQNFLSPFLENSRFYVFVSVGDRQRTGVLPSQRGSLCSGGVVSRSRGERSGEAMF